jgi:hypothetical protein
MRAYYDISLPLVPGWWLPSSVEVKKDVENPFYGKSDVVVAYPSGTTADPRKWRAGQQPHTMLANLGYSGWNERYTGTLTVEDVARFITRYGIFLFDPSRETTSPTEISLAEFRVLQERLREAWRRGNAKPLWHARGGQELDIFHVPLTWVDNELALHAADCWTYIRWLLARDLHQGYAKVCAYPDCPAPFCVKDRSDAKYCNHLCAVNDRNRINRLKLQKRRTR